MNVRRLSLLATLAASSIVLAAPASGVPGPESAADSATATVRTGSRDLNVRSAPSVTSQKIGTVRNGAKVVIVCHARGTVFTGGPFDLSTDLWNRLETGGYVTDAMLDTGSDEPIVPRCGTETMRLTSPRTAGATTRRNPAVEGTPLWGALEKWYYASGEKFYPAVRGAPRDVAASARATGWTVSDEPEDRAVVVIPPGVLDAPADGHVAWVDSVTNRPDGIYLRITEMGAAGHRQNTWSARTVKTDQTLSYILLP